MDFLQIFSAITGYLDIPAVVLGVMLVEAWRAVRSAQKREDFDFGNALKDENGKESTTRLGALVAICFSSWALMYDTIHGKQVNPEILLVYMGVLIVPKMAEKLFDALVAKWSK